MSMLEQERTRKVMMTKMISLLDVRLATWILRRCLTMMEQMLFKIVDAMTSIEDIRKYSLYPSPFSCKIWIDIWVYNCWIKPDWRWMMVEPPERYQTSSSARLSPKVLNLLMNIFSSEPFYTSKTPKASFKNILAKKTVKIGRADKIIFCTDNGICWMAKYAAKQWIQEMMHLKILD